MTETHIVFARPCHEDWAMMRPEARARWSESCRKPVHDLSLHTPEEVDQLFARAAELPCLRADIMPGGEVVTRPSRTGRRLTAAVAIPALFIALSALAGAAAAADPSMGAISGVLRIDNPAAVRVTAVAPGVRRSARVNESGQYRLVDLPPGTYRLLFSAPHAVKWSIDQVPVQPSLATVRDTHDPRLSIPAVPPMPTAGIPLPPPNWRPAQPPPSTAPPSEPNPPAQAKF